MTRRSQYSNNTWYTGSHCCCPCVCTIIDPLLACHHRCSKNSLFETEAEIAWIENRFTAIVWMEKSLIIASGATQAISLTIEASLTRCMCDTVCAACAVWGLQSTTVQFNGQSCKLRRSMLLHRIHCSTGTLCTTLFSVCVHVPQSNKLLLHVCGTALCPCWNFSCPLVAPVIFDIKRTSHSHELRCYLLIITIVNLKMMMRTTKKPQKSISINVKNCKKNREKNLTSILCSWWSWCQCASVHTTWYLYNRCPNHSVEHTGDIK